jgi:hypothetical protein
METVISCLPAKRYCILTCSRILGWHRSPMSEETLSHVSMYVYGYHVTIITHPLWSGQGLLACHTGKHWAPGGAVCAWVALEASFPCGPDSLAAIFGARGNFWVERSTETRVQGLVHSLPPHLSLLGTSLGLSRIGWLG